MVMVLYNLEVSQNSGKNPAIDAHLRHAVKNMQTFLEKNPEMSRLAFYFIRDMKLLEAWAKRVVIAPSDIGIDFIVRDDAGVAGIKSWVRKHRFHCYGDSKTIRVMPKKS